MIAYSPGSTDELKDEKPLSDGEPQHSLAEVEENRIHGLIEQRAYFLAERRGFEPGHDLDDWLQAEAEVLDGLASAAL